MNENILRAINSGYDVTVQFYNYDYDEYFDARIVDEAYFNLTSVNGSTQYDIDYANESLRFIIVL